MMQFKSFLTTLKTYSFILMLHIVAVEVYQNLCFVGN